MEYSGNLNYMAYKVLQKLRGKVLRTIPDRIIPRDLNLGGDLQIAVTTYVDRYELYFKPLYMSLKRIFPDINIYVAVNGFHDQDVQGKYLLKLEEELCNRQMGNNTFILHDKPVGLTYLWNELLSQGCAKTTLILNDDLRVYPWFRRWIEKKVWSDNITLINASWSHFFIDKHMVDTVGWFDEHFKGIGFEDMDYTARCALKKVPINNLVCQYIQHLDHQPTRTSFDHQSSTLWGPKYSSINHDTFFEKWRKCSHDSGIFIKQLNSYIEPIDSMQIDDYQYVHSLSFCNGICFPDRL